MLYRRMGRSGLQLSALSLGSWVTFGRQVGRGDARSLIAAAFDAGLLSLNEDIDCHGGRLSIGGYQISDTHRDHLVPASDDEVHQQALHVRVVLDDQHGELVVGGFGGRTRAHASLLVRAW